MRISNFKKKKSETFGSLFFLGHLFGTFSILPIVVHLGQNILCIDSFDVSMHGIRDINISALILSVWLFAHLCTSTGRKFFGLVIIVLVLPFSL